VGGPYEGRLDPVLGGALGVELYLGWHFRAGCCPCIIECIASTSVLTIPLQNCLYQNLN
jgi:hypothetical protein